MAAQIDILAPSELTMDGAKLTAHISDVAGREWQAWIQYRRSDKPYWKHTYVENVSAAPHTWDRTVKTTAPNYQHECRAYMYSFWPYPPQTITTDPMRFWFIPGSPRGKGAPFLVTDYAISSQNLNVVLALTTDIPCRLKLRISDIAPENTVKIETKRGRKTRHHPWLIWQWKWTATQEEAGDSIYHTFRWTAPMANTRYYLQAWGTTDNKTSPSRSPFYEIYVEITEPVELCYAAPQTFNESVQHFPCWQIASNFSPCVRLLPASITWYIRPHLQTTWPTHVKYSILANSPTNLPGTLIATTGYVATPPYEYKIHAITAPIACPILEPGTQYWMMVDDSRYPRQRPTIQFYTCYSLGNSCPPMPPQTQRLVRQMCTYTRYTPCTCVGVPWTLLLTKSLAYRIDGYPQ